MRAAVLLAPGVLSLEEVITPACPEGGMLIKVDACSVCASDVKMVRSGHRDLVYPRVLGHEVAGTVMESRSRRRTLSKGCRVQVWPGSACGSCPQCRKGMDNQCQSVGIIGFNLDGGFGEVMAVPEGCVRSGGVNLLPDDLGADVASLAEPLACCVNAQSAVRLVPGESVLIVGGGPLGALHAMLARHKGAGHVVLVEKEEARRRLLVQAGTDRIFDSIASMREHLHETPGGGFDVVVMATPEVPVDSSIVEALAARGRVSVFSGLPGGRSTATIDLNAIHYAERSLVGSYGCRSADCRRALQLIAMGAVDPSWLITKRVSLECIEDALQHAGGREGMKAVVTKN